MSRILFAAILAVLPIYAFAGTLPTCNPVYSQLVPGQINYFTGPPGCVQIQEDGDSSAYPEETGDGGFDQVPDQIGGCSEEESSKKSDNSDSNKKGGNKHDRKDKPQDQGESRGKGKSK